MIRSPMLGTGPAVSAALGAQEEPGPSGVGTAIEVVVPAGDVDLASGLLWTAGVTAVAEHPEGGSDVRLRADVPEGGVEGVRVALGGRWPVVEVRLVDDGLDAWRRHAEVVRAGRRLVVRPPWLPLGEVAPDAVVLEIDPGRSFGHGAHPTTRLCLAAVEEVVDARSGISVLDVGSGSGVLAVAAARLGAERVVAVDIDPAAVAATEHNAVGNGVAREVEVALISGAPGRDPGPAHPVVTRSEGTGASSPRGVAPGAPGARIVAAAIAGVDPLAEVSGRFDLVVANIGARALVDLAPVLTAGLADGGTLVLSGLLDPPPPEVATAYATLSVVDQRRLDGWTALVLAAPG